MTGPDPGDPLEDALVRAPYLEDDGFTEGVMARLPAPRPRRRLALLAPFFVAAAALAAAVLPRAVAVVAAVVASPGGTAAGWALAAVGLSLAGAGFTAALRAAGPEGG